MGITESHSFTENTPKEKFRIGISIRDCTKLLEYYSSTYEEDEFDFLNDYVNIDNFYEFLVYNGYTTEENVIKLKNEDWGLIGALIESDYAIYPESEEKDNIKAVEEYDELTGKARRLFASYMQEHQELIVALMAVLIDPEGGGIRDWDKINYIIESKESLINLIKELEHNLDDKEKLPSLSIVKEEWVTSRK